ncbi:hypothetical protein ScPMuIL_014242 [Solemya velum]
MGTPIDVCDSWGGIKRISESVNCVQDMPKRPNPFGDCPMQTKTHISQKEVDTGVNRDKNMKAVYDRTLELLFSGAKKSIKPFQADPNENLIEQPSFENEPMDQGIPDKPASDQMIFNNKGHLVKPNPTCTQGRKDDSLGETTGADARKS